MEQRKVRYGILGYGRFAERSIAPAILESPNSELIALQKQSLGEAQAKAEQLNIPYAFASVEELVHHPDVDAVFICSPNALHAEQTVCAAKAKKHVIVEKPMAVNTREARMMIDTCRENNVKLMVAHMVRFSPAIQWLRKLVRAGTMGTLQYIRAEYVYDARRSPRTWLYNRRLAGGGPWFDIGVHCVDTMRYILGEEVVSVKGHLVPTPTEERTESTAIVNLQFASGVLGSVMCSFETPFRRSIIELIGTESIVALSDFTMSDQEVDIVIVDGKNGLAEPPQYHHEFVPNLYEREITLFSDAILDNTEPPVPGEEGLKNQEILEAALQDCGITYEQ
ncbi:MAG: Gfo/Idh/MocA family oxidoreductase [Bacteroidetes bacterium]|nr:Gfo/Idh/MocA family oxidoreductase [Bacteroidota bacterium]